MAEWRQGIPESKTDDIDVCFLAYNRLEFTRASYESLLANTDWSLVSTLYLYDDGSTDGTREYLEQAATTAPVKAVFSAGKWRCPLVILLDCVARSTARYIAKIDNDVICPPLWLNRAKAAMDADETLDLLGLGYNKQPVAGPETTEFTVELATFIGGVGLFRRGVLCAWYRQDTEEWRTRDKVKREFAGIDQRDMRVGWLKPDLPMILLDRIPVEPWASLSRGYIASGLQRDWRRYGNDSAELWEWWTKDQKVLTT